MTQVSTANCFPQSGPFDVPVQPACKSCCSYNRRRAKEDRVSCIPGKISNKGKAKCTVCRQRSVVCDWGNVIPTIMNDMKLAIHSKQAEEAAAKEAEEDGKRRQDDEGSLSTPTTVVRRDIKGKAKQKNNTDDDSSDVGTTPFSTGPNVDFSNEELLEATKLTFADACWKNQEAPDHLVGEMANTPRFLILSGRFIRDVDPGPVPSRKILINNNTSPLSAVPMDRREPSWALLAVQNVILWEASQYTFYKSDKAGKEVSTIPGAFSVAMSTDIQSPAGLEKAVGALTEIAVRISTRHFYRLVDNAFLTEGNVLQNAHHARMEQRSLDRGSRLPGASELWRWRGFST